jgi:alkylation response protein AidB-like acyl-CoA dehydrogenase
VSTDTDYRERARAWLAENAPATTGLGPMGSSGYVAAAKAFARKLFDAGFAGITWPAEYGGQGLGPTEDRVYREEAERYHLPTAMFDITFGMCGPIILDLGTEEQKQRYIRPMLKGEEVWCQLFSEPAAGSDVAGLLTTATRDPAGGFRLNGQKVWTTGAQYSDFGIILARTDPDKPKHRGITMFIVDMHDPGVTVRPLRDISGEPHFNEVFFDDVHVGADAIVGELDGGWNAARVLLTHERLAVSRGGGMEDSGTGPLSFLGLVELAKRSGTVGDPTAVEELLDLYLLETSIGAFNDRIAAESARGIDPGARGSVGKILKARREKQAGQIAARLSGGRLVAHDGDTHATVHAMLYGISLSLGGGTDEIQLGILGERVLGLPREAQAGLQLPFRQALALQKGGGS